MKKILVVLNLFSLFGYIAVTSCFADGSRGKIKSKISKIEIVDRVALHWCLNGKANRSKTITSPEDIQEFQTDLNALKEVQDADTKYNVGYYRITLYFDDNTREQADLIYTVYDGVVFRNLSPNKNFKNNHMEVLVGSYFSR